MTLSAIVPRNTWVHLITWSFALAVPLNADGLSEDYVLLSKSPSFSVP